MSSLEGNDNTYINTRRDVLPLADFIVIGVMGWGYF